MQHPRSLDLFHGPNLELVEERAPGPAPAERLRPSHPDDRPEQAPPRTQATEAGPHQPFLIPPSPDEGTAGDPAAGAVRVHLAVHEASVRRTAWAALTGQPGIQVVSTSPAASSKGDIRVETVPARSGNAAGTTPAGPAPGAARLVALVPDETDASLGAALAQGAWATLREADVETLLLANVLAVGRGECPILRAAASRAPLAAALVRRYGEGGIPAAPEPPSPSPLTVRETEILGAISRGFTSGAIAAQLGLGLQTIKNQVAGILRKTGTRRRAEAVALALRNGWVTASDGPGERPGDGAAHTEPAPPPEQPPETRFQRGLML